MPLPARRKDKAQASSESPAYSSLEMEDVHRWAWSAPPQASLRFAQLPEEQHAIYNRNSADFSLLNVVDFTLLGIISADDHITFDSICRQASDALELDCDEQLQRYVLSAVTQMEWVGLAWRELRT